VFAGRDQALHDLAMQVVGHDHADDIDVGFSAIACQDVSFRSYPKRRAASEPSSGLMSPIETYRKSGRVDS
jgi:hypothetical protein